MYSKTLYSLDLNGRIRQWTVEVDFNKYRTTSGLIDGAKVTSEWTEVFGKNTGRSNETSDEEQALKVAERMVELRREHFGGKDTAEEALTSEKKAYVQCMLANKIQNVKYLDYGNLFIQRKLDGCRCLAMVDKLQTRTGKVWMNSEHIFRKLKPVFEKYPDLILDGELYCHSVEDNFSEIVSTIKKTKPTEEDRVKSEKYVQYWIYDVASHPGSFIERNQFIKDLWVEFPEVFDDSFVQVETYKISSKEDIDRYLEQFVSEGYEGAIVRVGDALYDHTGRHCNALLKVKKFNDEEFSIIRIEEGKGNLSGKAGRVVVDVDGVEVAAGLKFSHQEAVEIWKNRDTLIGKMATIKYFGDKTPDGSLRFPKCIQIDRESYE